MKAEKEYDSKMRISCEMVEDLLPLYLDDSCSKDSRIAVEEHLRACQDCSDKLSRMQSDIMDDRQEPAERPEPDLTELAEKIRRHRIRVAGFAVLAIMMLSVLLTLGYLTVQDMYSQMHPYVREVEEGTQNLAAGAWEMRAEQIEQSVFYTNNTQIKVSVQAGEGFQGTGTIKLWNMIYKDDFIQTADVEEQPIRCCLRVFPVRTATK